MKLIRRTFIAAAIGIALAASAHAAGTIKIASLQELSGAGATVGTNFKNGMDLAIKEINAAGGILGEKIEVTHSDTQSNPGVAKGLAQKAVDDGVLAVFGPGYSGSMMVSMNVTERAKVPNFTGAEAASITQQGDPYVIRTSFGQQTSMPKIARYMAQNLKAKTVAVIYVNNDFGKGGAEMVTKALAAYGAKVVASISTEQGQLDFATPVLKAKQSNADVVFVYTNEEEAARALRELRKQGVNKPIVGETVLTSQKVIELAGDAANGAIAHVGLTVDAPVPALEAFKTKFVKAYNYLPDHNCIKGYTGVYIMKAALEKAGKIDREALNKAVHGLYISAAKDPGVLMDVYIDAKGDLDRESFLTEVKGGKQVVSEVLPMLAKH
ncbi:MAG: ABC transporter substrate-binding protein [Burkholderiales bacterium]|nr:ABC transporter substrate-binding protein [Burkholderiales bacterium]MDE1929640.1 ABC transporter substrate-binding protein [Burkholderiales bacterium]MDE2159421.1 ABC transporter substrate-binding protein [Burkholderiales bacterium]